MRLREKDEAMQKIEADFSKDLAAAQYATDTTESRMGSRALLEGALDVIWATHMAAKHQHAEAWQRLKADGPCPGLLAYLPAGSGGQWREGGGAAAPGGQAV